MVLIFSKFKTICASNKLDILFKSFSRNIFKSFLLILLKFAFAKDPLITITLFVLLFFLTVILPSNKFVWNFSDFISKLSSLIWNFKDANISFIPGKIDWRLNVNFNSFSLLNKFLKFAFNPMFFDYKFLSLIHIWRCRRYAVCRSRWSPYH